MADRLWNEARAAWPEISMSRQAFDDLVASRGGNDAELKGPDLYLAGACAAGDERAAAELSALIRREVSRAARGRAFADDVAQRVSERLLVGEAPRIAEYAGRGSLRGWLRVVVARAVIDEVRGDRRRELPADDRELFELPAQGDPQLSFLKDHYRDEFRGAFERALASLAARERRLLRHQFVDELGIDEIGGLYRVHRATAARWLSKARDGLLSSTRRELASRLELGRPELESVMRLIQSQLHVSLCRLLQSGDHGGSGQEPDASD